jgi:3-hydroxyisobutyrate dehydrogenase-like beta-hydroxyacid dehydrogenase
MNRPPVTVMGLGAMGSAVANVLVSGNHPTTVWNRTPGKAQALAVRGATPAATAAEAAAASPLVIVCVTDYAATTAILDAMAAAAAGRVLVNLTTGTPDEAHAMAARACEAGAVYLDGAVQAGPGQIGTPAATMFYAGAEKSFTRHAATLGRLGSATYVGTDSGQACRWDLALLGLWYETEAAYFNALALVGAPDTDPAAFVPFVRRQLGHVVDAVPDVAKQIHERQYPPGPAPLSEHARVLQQLVQARRAGGMAAGHAESLHEAALRLVARGAGSDGFTKVIEELAGSARH